MAINSPLPTEQNTGLISMVPDLLFIPQYVGLSPKTTVTQLISPTQFRQIAREEESR